MISNFIIRIIICYRFSNPTLSQSNNYVSQYDSDEEDTWDYFDETEEAAVPDFKKIDEGFEVKICSTLAIFLCVI